ncbi:hypothetical protein CYMTET_25542, partial [Cymbomonas tetramitiformis]
LPFQGPAPLMSAAGGRSAPVFQGPPLTSAAGGRNAQAFHGPAPLTRIAAGGRSAQAFQESRRWQCCGGGAASEHSRVPPLTRAARAGAARQAAFQGPPPTSAAGGRRAQTFQGPPLTSAACGRSAQTFSAPDIPRSRRWPVLRGGRSAQAFQERPEGRPSRPSSDGGAEARGALGGRGAMAPPRPQTSEPAVDRRSTFWHAETSAAPEEEKSGDLRETPGVSLVPTRMRASTMPADTTEERGITLLAAMPAQDTEAILNLAQQTTVPKLQRQIRASQIDAQVASTVESLWGMLPLEIANQLSSRRLISKPEECAAILAQLARRAGLMQDVSHGFQTGEQLVANVLKNIPPAAGAKILMLLPGDVGAGTMICLPAAARDALLETLPADDLIQMVAAEEGDVAVPPEEGEQAESWDPPSAEQTIQSPASPSAIPSVARSEPAVAEVPQEIFRGAEVPQEIVRGVRLLAQLLGVHAESELDEVKEAGTRMEVISSLSLPSSAPPNHDSTSEDECGTPKAVIQLLQRVVGHVAQMDLKQKAATWQAHAAVVEMREENAKLHALLNEAKREVDTSKRACSQALKRHREATELGIKTAAEAGMAKGEALLATQAHEEEVAQHAVTSAALKAVTEAYQSEQKDHEAVSGALDTAWPQLRHNLRGEG